MAQAGGKLYCWGTGSAGELGSDPDREGTLPFPTEVAGVTDAVKVCCGDMFTVYMTAAGDVFSFGSNAKGRLLGHSGEGKKPRKVKGVAQARDIAAGQSHTLVVAGDDGRVFAWGSPLWHALGNGGNTGSDAAPVVGSDGKPLQGIATVAAGYQNSAAVTRDGVLYTWGANQHGKLGLGSKDTAVEHPTVVELPEPVQSVSLGSVFSAAITTSGRVFTWGYGLSGCLGHGDRKSHSRPVEVAALAGVPVVAISCTSGQINPVTSDVHGKENPHTLAVTRDGRALAWGTCHKGMLGNHTKKILSPPNGDELTPYTIGAPARDGVPGQPTGYLHGITLSGCASSSIHSAFVSTDGDVFVLGCGSGGRMGIEKYMSGLHGARSRMKCYVQVPTAIEYFATHGLVVSSVSTSRRHMAAVVAGTGPARPTHGAWAVPHTSHEHDDGDLSDSDHGHDAGHDPTAPVE